MALTVKKSPSWSIGQSFNVRGQTSLSGAAPGPTISQNGLILYLDAGNPASYTGGSVWYDMSGNGHDAVISGAPTYTAAHGGGYNFDNSADYFSLYPHLQESYVSTGLSVAAWVKADSLPYVSAIMTRSDWGSNDGWALHQHFNNTIMGPRFGSATSNNYAVTANVVYYVAFTIDVSGNAKVYINGVQDGSTATSVTVPTAASSSPVIGLFQPGGYTYAWNGDIYQIHMYNRALTSGEMLANFNATKSRYGL